MTIIGNSTGGTKTEVEIAACFHSLMKSWVKTMVDSGTPPSSIYGALCAGQLALGAEHRSRYEQGESDRWTHEMWNHAQDVGSRLGLPAHMRADHKMQHRKNGTRGVAVGTDRLQKAGFNGEATHSAFAIAARHSDAKRSDS